jgi:hypothetical protein
MVEELGLKDPFVFGASSLLSTSFEADEFIKMLVCRIYVVCLVSHRIVFHGL